MYILQIEFHPPLNRVLILPRGTVQQLFVMLQATGKRSRADWEGDVVGVSAELADFLSQHMSSFRCSAHDLKHCYRVARLALDIASSGGSETPYDLRVVYLSGLLHDIMDSKLVDTSRDKISIEDRARELLRRCEHVDEASIDSIMRIVKSIGYKNLIKPDWGVTVAQFPAEYWCVQDADLLDAIGSIGLTRVFSYGGRKNRPIFGFTEELSLGVGKQLSPDEYAAREGGSIEHFFDKLLRIRALLRTARGKELGAKRHDRMVQFLMDIDDELLDAGDASAGCISILLQDEGIACSPLPAS